MLAIPERASLYPETFATVVEVSSSSSTLTVPGRPQSHGFSQGCLPLGSSLGSFSASLSLKSVNYSVSIFFLKKSYLDGFPTYSVLNLRGTSHQPHRCLL